MSVKIFGVGDETSGFEGHAVEVVYAVQAVRLFAIVSRLARYEDVGEVEISRLESGDCDLLDSLCDCAPRGCQY